MYDPNRYLDEIFDEHVASHQAIVLDPNVTDMAEKRNTRQEEEESHEFSVGNTPEDHSGIEFGEDPNYDARWECSFGDAEQENADTSYSSEEP